MDLVFIMLLDPARLSDLDVLIKFRQNWYREKDLYQIHQGCPTDSKNLDIHGQTTFFNPCFWGIIAIYSDIIIYN